MALVPPAAAASSGAGSLASLPPRAYVVGTYDGKSLRLYVNGALVARRTAHGSAGSSKAPLEIGSYAGQAVWAGEIDDVAVYNRALSPGAIARHYRLGVVAHSRHALGYRGAVVRTPGLVSYWRLDDRGGVARDLRGANPGRYHGAVGRGGGLISGDPDRGAVFDGHAGSIAIPSSESLDLRRDLTLEAWVTTTAVGNHAIIGRIGSYYLVTNALGDWDVGASIGGKTYSAASTFAARAPTTQKPERTRSGSGGGFDPIWLAILAVPVAAAVVLLRRRGWPRDPGSRAGRGSEAGPPRPTAAPARPQVRQATASAPPAPHAWHLPLMDSMRAIAALLVLVTHAAVFSGEDVGTGAGPYFQHLDIGVAIFFLISGLLLYRPFALAHLQGRAALAAGPYAWRRVLRIVPAYWLALTVIVLVIGSPHFAPGVFTYSGLPRYYLFGQAYWRETIGGGLGQAWTLSIEVAFYAFLPLYAWIQRRTGSGYERALRAEILGLVLLVAISLAWNVGGVASGSPTDVAVGPWLTSLPGYLDQFALGMGLGLLSAWIRVRGRSPRWVSTFDRASSLSWVVAAIGFWLVTRVALPLPRFAHWTPAQYVGRHWLYALIALALLLPAVIGDQRLGVVRRVLRLRLLAWLGLISYGIYLWHVAVLEGLKRVGFTERGDGFAYIAWPVACLVITAAIAAASYYGLERPALSLKRLVDGNGYGSARPQAAAPTQRASAPTATSPAEAAVATTSSSSPGPQS